MCAAVRGSRGFEDGMHYWDIVFLEPPAGTSVMVGVGTSRALLTANYRQYVNLIGKLALSVDVSFIVISYV